ncbi:DUF6587 family protein [Granulibacter bethesdensis]|uniref:DUF6587 family protein n=1 Tax=Granulibacter bethesdensis TaxID=364410 RepID=UPI0003F21884|nr:DUF6587 family protein [Granulibacter bethesdensis]AHJ68540.1 Hypothetical protein GbCGDNIH2_5063 [Granulibacter bethesdensis]
MLQSIIAGIAVLICALFWMQKLAPRAMAPLWSAMSALLRRMRVMPALAERLSPTASPSSAGCKGCDSCGGSKGGCH